MQARKPIRPVSATLPTGLVPVVKRFEDYTAPQPPNHQTVPTGLVPVVKRSDNYTAPRSYSPIVPT